MLTNLRMVKGYDETTVTLLSLARTFSEKPDRKGAYTDTMNLVTPRILRQGINKGEKR